MHIFPRGVFYLLARFVGWAWVICWFLAATAYPPVPESTLDFRYSGPPVLSPGARQDVVFYFFHRAGSPAQGLKAAFALRRPDGRWLGPTTLKEIKPGSYQGTITLPAEISEGGVEPWISVNDRPFLPISGVQLQIRHLAQMAVLPPPLPMHLGDPLKFSLAVLDAVSGGGSSGFPVLAKVIDPSGITIIKREVFIGHQGLGEFSCFLHSRGRPGIYRFEFSAGDRQVIWEIPLQSPLLEGRLQREVSRFTRGMMPLPWFRTPSREVGEISMVPNVRESEAPLALKIHTEPRKWVFTSTEMLSPGEIWECWFRHRLLATTGPSYSGPFRAEIERTREHTGIFNFSSWKPGRSGDEGNFAFPMLIETGTARGLFGQLADLVPQPRVETLRRLLFPGRPFSFEGRIILGQGPVSGILKESGRLLILILGLLIGFWLLKPAWIPEGTPVRLAGVLLLTMVVGARWILSDVPFVLLSGLLFCVAFWPGLFKWRPLLRWNLKTEGFWTLNGALLCFWGVVLPLHRWFLRPIDGLEPSLERLGLFSLLLAGIALATGEWPQRLFLRWRSASAAWWFRREVLLGVCFLLGWHLLFGFSPSISRSAAENDLGLTAVLSHQLEIVRVHHSRPDDLQTLFRVAAPGLPEDPKLCPATPTIPLFSDISMLPRAIHGSSRFFLLQGNATWSGARILGIRVFQSERDFLDRLLRRVGGRRNRLADLAIETLLRTRRYRLLSESGRKGERIQLEGLAVSLAREERLQNLQSRVAESRQRILCGIFKELSQIIFIDQPLVARFCGIAGSDTRVSKTHRQNLQDLLEQGIFSLSEHLENFSQHPEIYGEGGGFGLKGAGGRGDPVFPLNGETLILRRGRSFPEGLDIIGMESKRETPILIEVEFLLF